MITLRNFKRFFYKSLKQPLYAFKVFFKRFKSYLSYLLYEGKSSYPEAITLFLTHRCNLRCKMCGQWGEGGITKKQSSQYIKTELSWEELKAVIDDMATFKPNITLFGGEPLLYPDCLQLIRYIKQKGMHCLVITNGSLLENLAEDIVESGLDELNVSLDAQAELHDQIRGMPGLFDKIMRGLKQINYFKVNQNKKEPLVNLQCTITKHNYKFLEQLLVVADEARANSLTFHNLIFLDQEIINQQKEFDRLLNCDSVDWEGFVFNPELDVELLYEKIKKIKSGSHSFSIDFYPNFSRQELRDYYQHKYYQPAKSTARCLSPWIVAYIFPDGQVKPCLNFSYSYGNIKKDRFTEIWNNSEAIKFRREVKRNKIFPVCSRCTELYRY